MTTTIGVDIGGTKALAVRCVDGVVVADHRVDSAGPALAVLVDALRRVSGPEVEAVGAGLAGLVDYAAGTFVWGPHLSGTRLEVREALEREFGLPVTVDNDANTTAWAELQVGAARGFRNVLVVTVGTGIGGAVVIDGAIYRGAGFAGEWGHSTFDSDGPGCDCGRIGCWETAASGPALGRLAGEHLSAHPHGSLARRIGAGPPDPMKVAAAALDGDGEAMGLLVRVGRDLGRGLAGLIAVFDPDLVVVGGGFGSLGDPLLDPARRAAAKTLFGGSHRSPPPIVQAELGGAAGAVGAALMAAHLLRR